MGTSPLQVCLIDTRVRNLLFRSFALYSLLFCSKSLILKSNPAHAALYKRVTLSKSLFTKELLWANNSRHSLQKNDLSELLWLLFTKERCEQISCDLSELLEKNEWFICFRQCSRDLFTPKSKSLSSLFTHLLFFKERKGYSIKNEQIDILLTKKAICSKNRRAKFQPCPLVSYIFSFFILSFSILMYVCSWSLTFLVLSYLSLSRFSYFLTD